MPITVFTCRRRGEGAWPHSMWKGAERRRVWVKGDPSPPGQRQSPVRDASPPTTTTLRGGSLQRGAG